MEENQDQNEKLQELSIIVNDRLQGVGRGWWYALAVAVVLTIPAYFVLRGVFTTLVFRSHNFPAYIYQEDTKVPLQVTEKKIFKLGTNSYAGYIKIRNSSNYNWGVINQPYTAVFTTTGGTEVTRINSSAFILPSSEKIIVFTRFTSDKEPTILNVALGDTQFIKKPNRPDPSLDVQRVNLLPSVSGLVVTAVVKNNTPFTIKAVGLPVLLYDAQNRVVGANYTNINDLTYGETRSFQFTWPVNPGAARAEILPEVNLFDTNIYTLPAGTPQFDPPPATP